MGLNPLHVIVGIGSIPDAVLCKLGNHRDLGVHTEMFSDGIIDLVHTGEWGYSNTSTVIWYLMLHRLNQTGNQFGMESG